MAVRETETAETRRYGRAAGLLSIGVASAGMLTYVFFAISSHQLGRVEYGEIVVLWSAVFVTISTLFRPVEQLLSRTLAEREARGQPIGSAIRVAAQIQFALALGFVALALTLRDSLQDELLSGDERLYWVLVGAVTAFGASFFARGVLAGTRRFAPYALLLVLESGARVAFAFAVAVGIANGQFTIALGVVAAPCAGLLALPIAIWVTGRSTVPKSAAGEGSGEALTLAHGGGFAAAVLLIMIAEQTFLNAGPLIARGTSGAAAAGFIFNILMVARAPLVLFQAVATSLLPHLTRLRSREDDASEAAFEDSVRATLQLVAAFAAAVIGAMAIAGPDLMQIAFSAKFDYDRAGLVIVAAGMGFYLASATLTQAALAQGQARRAALRWVICAAGFLAWSLSPVLDEVRRIEVGFAAGALVLCAMLVLLYLRPRPRAEDRIEPGSPREIEAQLAAGDEAAEGV